MAINITSSNNSLGIPIIKTFDDSIYCFWITLYSLKNGKDIVKCISPDEILELKIKSDIDSVISEVEMIIGEKQNPSRNGKTTSLLSNIQSGTNTILRVNIAMFDDGKMDVNSFTESDFQNTSDPNRLDHKKLSMVFIVNNIQIATKFGLSDSFRITGISDNYSAMNNRIKIPNTGLQSPYKILLNIAERSGIMVNQSRIFKMPSTMNRISYVSSVDTSLHDSLEYCLSNCTNDDTGYYYLHYNIFSKCLDIFSMKDLIQHTFTSNNNLDAKYTIADNRLIFPKFHTDDPSEMRRQISYFEDIQDVPMAHAINENIKDFKTVNFDHISRQYKTEIKTRKDILGLLDYSNNRFMVGLNGDHELKRSRNDTIDNHIRIEWTNTKYNRMYNALKTVTENNIPISIIAKGSCLRNCGQVCEMTFPEQFYQTVEWNNMSYFSKYQGAYMIQSINKIFNFSESSYYDSMQCFKLNKPNNEDSLYR